jgi:hypothetical protein
MLVLDGGRIFLLVHKHAAPSILPHVPDVDDVPNQRVQIFSVKQDCVNEGGTDGQVVDEEEESVGRAEPRWPNRFVFGLVESVVGQKGGLVVLVAVRVENTLRHEGKRSSSPDIAIIDRTHQYIRQEDAKVHVELGYEWCIQAGRSDVVPERLLSVDAIFGNLRTSPVQRPGKEAHTLIVGATTEDVP